MLALILPLSRLAYRGGRIVTWQRMVVQRWRGSPWVGWQAWGLQGVDFFRASWGMGTMMVVLRKNGWGEGYVVVLILALVGSALTLWQAWTGAARAGECYARPALLRVSCGFCWGVRGCWRS